MEVGQAQVGRTLRLIEDANLPHPSGLLLCGFVTEAVNPVVAAQYVEDRFSAGQSNELLADWRFVIESITTYARSPTPPDVELRKAISRRDEWRCCITGKSGTFWDPLVVRPILPIPSRWASAKASVIDLLGAFFGPSYRDWWLEYAEDERAVMPFHNLWLVRQSAARAFAQGLVRLDRLQPSMVEFEVRAVNTGADDPINVNGPIALLGDHSRLGFEKVDPRFVGTQARMAESIRFQNLAAEHETRSSSYPASSSGFVGLVSRCSSYFLLWEMFSPQSLLRYLVLPIWRMFPDSIRFAAYRRLQHLGERLYGQTHRTVQRLPFGLFLKYHTDHGLCRNEYETLQLLRRKTTIPVPVALDSVLESAAEADPYSTLDGYILMTSLPGKPLNQCHSFMFDKDVDQIGLQLKDYISQIRSLPKTVNPDVAICNTLGKACIDPRVQGGRPVGPFPDEAAFSQCVRFSDEPSRRGHRILFTHADLNPRNILVDQTVLSGGTRGWKVTGIVDWETAGYYPEYWEFTKAMFEGFRWRKRYNDFVKTVFNEFGDYSSELDVETRSWEMGDAV